MNQNELKLALGAMLYTPQDMSKGVVASNLPQCYVPSYSWEWSEFISSKVGAAAVAAASSNLEALYLTTQAFDSYLCGASSSDSRLLYLGARRVLQRQLAQLIAGTTVLREAVEHPSSDQGFGSLHSLILEPNEGTVASLMQRLGLKAGLWLAFPNLRVVLTPSEVEERLALIVSIDIRKPLPNNTRCSQLCEQARRSSMIPRYKGLYL